MTTTLLDGYALAVNHEGFGAVLSAASQESVGLLWLFCQGGLRIGHGWVPRVFWGAEAPGARDVSFAIVPAALILMGDWNVPARHDSQVMDDPGAYLRQ